MAKSKHVKLGEKASLFYDPTSDLKVTPGKAVELSAQHKMSKRVVKAIKSGHLDYVDSEELQELDVVSLKKAPAKQEAAKEEEEEELTENKLSKMKKSELVALAKDYETGFTEEEIKDMKKEEIIDALLNE